MTIVSILVQSSYFWGMFMDNEIDLIQILEGFGLSKINEFGFFCKIESSSLFFYDDGIIFGFMLLDDGKLLLEGNSKTMLLNYLNN